MTDCHEPSKRRSTTTPAPRPPATSGTASRSSTRRCRAGGCGSSSAPSSGRSVYWILMPAWPGMHGYTPRPAAPLAARAGRKDLRGAGGAAQAQAGAADRRVARADRDRSRHCRPLRWPTASRSSATIARPATAPGGTGGQGYPNLRDDVWLWGGKLDDIQQHHHRRRALAAIPIRAQSQMPSLRPRRRSCKPDQIDDLTEYVRVAVAPPGRCGRGRRARRQALRRPTAPPATAPKGQGNQTVGAPNLTDNDLALRRRPRPRSTTRSGTGTAA